jgi:hypothetical protein
LALRVGVGVKGGLAGALSNGVSTPSARAGSWIYPLPPKKRQVEAIVRSTVAFLWQRKPQAAVADRVWRMTEHKMHNPLGSHKLRYRAPNLASIVPSSTIDIHAASPSSFSPVATISSACPRRGSAGSSFHSCMIGRATATPGPELRLTPPQMPPYACGLRPGQRGPSQPRDPGWLGRRLHGARVNQFKDFWRD